MTVGGGSVFISYRRQRSWSLALAVRDDLIKHRYDTFLDANLDSGEFPRAILSQIEAREHFIVLLAAWFPRPDRRGRRLAAPRDCTCAGP